MTRLLAMVIDRDAAVRASLQDRLAALGVKTLGAVSVSEARDRARDNPVDVVLGAPGDWIRDAAVWPRRPVRVALFSDSESLLSSGPEWLERGADDLLALDADPRASDLVLRRAAAWGERRAREAELREGVGSLVGRSAALESIRERLQRLAPIDQNLWIEGEAGAGRQSCARALHRLAAGAQGPFVLFEAADLETHGWEERWLSPSDDGVGRRLTLYLVEPGSFGPSAIERLQRLMLRLDGDGRAGMRVVSGSSVPLETLREKGALPAPLATLLAESRLRMPPLRERIEDVGPLALHFIRSIEQVNQLEPLRLSAEALDQLEAHSWPGNVRELRHAIEHAAILADGLIELVHLPRNLREAAVGTASSRGDLASRPFRDAKGEVVGEFEQAYLTSLMNRERGNVTAAARSSGMLRSALQRLLRKYGLRSADFRRRQAAGPVASTRAPRAD
jgi:DNA-binding NtrC family response regulator